MGILRFTQRKKDYGKREGKMLTVLKVCRRSVLVKKGGEGLQRNFPARNSVESRKNNFLTSNRVGFL